MSSFHETAIFQTHKTNHIPATKDRPAASASSSETAKFPSQVGGELFQPPNMVRLPHTGI
jgi:hypothetical protein